MNMKSIVSGVAIATSLIGAAEATNLVLNGRLEDSSYSPANLTQNITNPGLPPQHGLITNWTVSGYGSTAANWNAIYVYDSNPTSMLAPAPMPPAYRSCDPAFGYQATAISCPNPDGAGYFINLDGDPGFPTAISQTIATPLIKDQTYRLTFSWAAVQRIDATGPTANEYLTVSLGSQSFDTHDYFPGPTTDATKSLPTHGFSGWFTTNFDFVGDGTAGNVLSFMAHGNPGGHPPTVNLDGISLSAIPEPPIVALLIAAGLGLGGVGVGRRRHARVSN